MNTEKAQGENDLGKEYMRISENEAIYYDEVGLWDKLETISGYLLIISGLLTFLFFMSLPMETLDSLITNYPLHFYSFLISACLLIFSLLVSWLSDKKLSRIESELGLPREERLYLRVYETYINVRSYLEESNLRRKQYFRKLALENVEEVVEIVEGWKYGDIPLIRNLIGDQIDLFKNNLGRLVLSNVAKGDEKALTEFLKYFLIFVDMFFLHQLRDLVN